MHVHGVILIAFTSEKMLRIKHRRARVVIIECEHILIKLMFCVSQGFHEVF